MKTVTYYVKVVNRKLLEIVLLKKFVGRRFLISAANI